MLKQNAELLVKAIDNELFRQNRELTPAMLEELLSFLENKFRINIDIEDFED